jgi:hypothetical protein
MDRQRKRIGRTSVVVAALSMALIALWSAPAASEASSTPARFVYEQCDSALPGGDPPSYDFTTEPTSAYTAFQSCAAPGGAIGISETGPVFQHFSYLTIAVPETPEGFVEAETISASANLGPGNEYSHVYENGFPTSGAGESQRIFHIRSARAPFFGNGGGFNIAMTCNASCNAGGWIAAHYIAATEVDPSAPTLSGIQGTLLGSGVVRGHQTIAAEAHDLGGGLSGLSILANGLPAAAPQSGACNVFQVSNPSVYGAVAASPTPCPSELKASWTLDTQSYPFHDGANSVQFCASDYASLGNPNTTCSAPASISVDNSCTESPVPGGEALSAQFARSNAETITVDYGKSAEVTGELKNNAGDVISGATICVKSQTLGLQPAPKPVSAVTTDAEGRFSYPVPAGPNREIVLGYRHDSAQVARDVRYYAHAAPSLHANPTHLRNGSRVKLWGSLPRPGAGRRVVILQANVVGSKRWITFRRATTDGHGDFGSGYRFNSTTRKTNYRFRAVVPRQDHYPFVEGHSKPVKVLVRG